MNKNNLFPKKNNCENLLSLPKLEIFDLLHSIKKLLKLHDFVTPENIVLRDGEHHKKIGRWDEGLAGGFQGN